MLVHFLFIFNFTTRGARTIAPNILLLQALFCIGGYFLLYCSDEASFLIKYSSIYVKIKPSVVIETQPFS